MNTKAKHTPGPWHVGGKNGTVPIIYDADGWAVCDCRAYHGKTTPDMMRANAALIAAAPTLLAALQAFVDGSNTDPAISRELYEIRRMTAARAALAAAGVRS